MSSRHDPATGASDRSRWRRRHKPISVAPMSQAHLHPILTQCGLPGVDQIPYGIHMCHFYRERADLVEALVPFFSAGLHHNERCIWITAAPLEAADAQLALQKAGVDTDAAIRRGALTIQGYGDFYLKARGMKSSQVAELWLAEEQCALEDRKSTRLNSSHLVISYAIFCVKYKK